MNQKAVLSVFVILPSLTSSENYEQCGDFWMNPEELNRIIGTILKFNICGLETLCVANVDIDGLEQRVKDGIPESLQYSSPYWATHLTAANRAAVNQHVLDFFRSLTVLYWLEALSLIGELKEGFSAFQDIINLYEVRTGQP